MSEGTCTSHELSFATDVIICMGSCYASLMMKHFSFIDRSQKYVPVSILFPYIVLSLESTTETFSKLVA